MAITEVPIIKGQLYMYEGASKIYIIMCMIAKSEELVYLEFIDFQDGCVVDIVDLVVQVGNYDKCSKYCQRTDEYRRNEQHDFLLHFLAFHLLDKRAKTSNET